MSIRIRRRSAAIGLTALSLTGGLAACGEKAVDTPMKVYARPTPASRRARIGIPATPRFRRPKRSI